MNSPIGIFDSGLGGLSVWKAVQSELPYESIIYFGDGLRCPYGDKSLETVAGYTEEAVDYLINDRGVKMVIVACNTATAASIRQLRAKYPGFPIIGMEPAVKPAALTTKTGIIAVLATEGSLQGNHFSETASRFAGKVHIIPAVGAGFVELVEGGREDSPEALETVRKVIEPLIARGADRIVLGCTHYPFLTKHILSVIGDRNVEIMDSAPAIARRASQLLEENGITAPAGNIPSYEFHTLAGDDYLARMWTMSGHAAVIDL